MLRLNAQQVKSMKIKAVSQWVEDNVASRSLVGSVSFGILSDMTSAEDHVTGLDAESVEEKVIDLIVTRRTKKNPQKWVVKKHGSQVDELDQLKLKIIVLHDDRDEEIHMTRPIGFRLLQICFQLMIELSEHLHEVHVA